MSISGNTNVTKIEARFFNISLGLSQPLSISLSGFENVFGENAVEVKAYSYSLVG